MPSLAASMEVFDSTIEEEEYLMGETTQELGAKPAAAVAMAD